MAARLRCKHCKASFELTESAFRRRPVTGLNDAIELGLACPRGCWTHISYTSAEIELLATELQTVENETARELRLIEYRRQLADLQERVHNHLAALAAVGAEG